MKSSTTTPGPSACELPCSLEKPFRGARYSQPSPYSGRRLRRHASGSPSRNSVPTCRSELWSSWRKSSRPCGLGSSLEPRRRVCHPHVLTANGAGEACSRAFLCPSSEWAVNQSVSGPDSDAQIQIQIVQIENTRFEMI